MGGGETHSPIFRTAMVYVILVLILGLPVSPLIFNKLDIWHAAGFFSQTVIWSGFGVMLWGAAKQRTVSNLPIALLFIWCGITVLHVCHIQLVGGKYNTGTFFPFFNLLTILMLYHLLSYYLHKAQVCMVIKALQFVVCFTTILCTLQHFGLAQFTKMAVPFTGDGRANSQMIGFLGNGTHLSAFIGMMFPVLFINTSRQTFLTAVLCILLLTQCGEVAGDPALTGWAIILAYAIMFSLSSKRHWWISIVLFIGAVLYGMAHPSFTSFNGRIAIWSAAFDHIQSNFPLTGSGLGSVNMLAAKTQVFASWRHLHQEYLQYTLEIGLIGLALIANVVWNLITTKANDWTERCLKMSVMGFLISCFTLSSSHLWVMSVYATIFYSLFMALHEDTKWQHLQEKKLETV